MERSALGDRAGDAVTIKYPTCGHEGCQGHVGKFSSCRDELLWQYTLDGDADETFGDIDWIGHYAMIVISDHPSWTETPDSSDVRLTPKPGVYVVFTATSGRVDVEYLGDEAGVMATYEASYGPIRQQYEAWSAQEGD